MNRRTARQLIIASAAIGSLGTFALHLILPSLPAIRAHFGSSSGTTQLLVSLGLLAFALGQLAVAPWSDRIGRRPVILAGLALFCVGSILGLAAPSIGMLIAARIVQAFGSGAAMAVGRATIMDYFGPERVASGIAWSATAIVLVPLVAPAVGGFVVEWRGWRMLFVLCVLLGAAVFAFSWLRVRETRAAGPRAPRAQSALASYGQLLRAPDYFIFVLYGSFMVAGVYAFIAGAPYVAMDVMNLSPSYYGRLFILPAVATFVGFFLAARITRRYGMLRMMTAGLTLTCAGGVAMLALALLGVMHPLALFVPMAAANVGNALSAPSTLGGAVAARPGIAGAASGLMGFKQLLLAAVAAQIVASFAHRSTVPLACTIAACNALALLCYLRVRPHALRMR